MTNFTYNIVPYGSEHHKGVDYCVKPQIIQIINYQYFIYFYTKKNKVLVFVKNHLLLQKTNALAVALMRFRLLAKAKKILEPPF